MVGLMQLALILVALLLAIKMISAAIIRSMIEVERTKQLGMQLQLIQVDNASILEPVKPTKMTKWGMR